MYARPLFDLLRQVRVKHKVVGRAMPGLHPRVGASPRRVHRLDLSHPLLLRLPDVAVGARRVRTDGGRPGRSGQATRGDPGVGRSRSEEVRVRGGEGVGHHSPGRGAGDEDLGRVGAVLLDRVLDHGGENLGVAAALVGEGLGRRDVPAVEVVGGAREDGDEAVLLRQGVVLGLLGVSWSITTAAVELHCSPSALFLTSRSNTYREDDSWLGCEFGWNIDIHLEICWVRTEIRDLNQGAHHHGAEHRKYNEATVGERSWCHLDLKFKGRAKYVEFS